MNNLGVKFDIIEITETQLEEMSIVNKDIYICGDFNINLLDSDSHSGGHSGRVVTLWPPTSEAGVRSPSRPYVGKLVVACRWLAVYSTEP